LLVRIAVVAVAIFAALVSIRDWSVRAPHDHPLTALGSWWKGHPRVATERLMLESAIAARSGKSLDSASRARIHQIAQDAPLQPDPFVIAGALAQLDGETTRAENLYGAARLRDSRAPAVRLLLADLQLRSGKIGQGLANLVAVVRIAPYMGAPVVPGLAEFARSPGAVSEMRSAFAKNPTLGAAVLDQLATDPANGPLILALAPRSGAAAPPLAPWQQRLVDSTYGAGRVALAREYWARFNGIAAGASGLVFNPSFQHHPASPPFNWSYSSGSAGMADVASEGGLSIVHFGREPALLARQLLALPPGSYAVKTQLTRQPKQGLIEWRIQCLDGSQAQVIPAGPQSRLFRVGASCPGTWLSLHALPSESQERFDTIVRRVDVKKVG